MNGSVRREEREGAGRGELAETERLIISDTSQDISFMSEFVT